MSGTVFVRNTQSQDFSLEASCMTLQGQHATVRALIPAGTEKAVPLPVGVTAELLANSPEVIAESRRASPRYSIRVGGQTGLPSSLANYETISTLQAAPASVVAPGLVLGTAKRGGQVSRLRISGQTATGAGESYTINEIRKNGVNVLVAPIATLVLPAATAARVAVEADLSSLLITAEDRDYFEVVTTYVAGAATLTNVLIELVLARP